MNKNITKPYDHTFKISSAGLVGIFVSARCKSKEQISSNTDEDLRVEINSSSFREIPPEKNIQLFNIPPAFNGSKLRGLKKTVVFLTVLEKGENIITLVPRSSAFVEEIEIQEMSGEQALKLDLKNIAEDGDRRPWITFVLVDLPLEYLTASFTTKWRFRDSDDVKLIINNRIYKNPNSFFYRNWLWSGSIFKKLLRKETQDKTIKINLLQGIHYVEFWADRIPILHKLEIGFGRSIKRIPNQYNPKWTDNNFATDTEQMILARAVFGEARSLLLSDKARIAVAWSIRNRVEDKRWGDTYKEVILQPVQYSAFDKSDLNREFVEDPFGNDNDAKENRKSWIKCYEIAGRVMNEEIDDPIGGANHYYDDSMENPPYWAEAGVLNIKIDSIFFYRL